EKEQQDALVYYNNQYTKNKGIDITSNDRKAFEVVASLSGTVTKSEKDPLLGNVVEIQHENGMKTVYQSLADVHLEVGDTLQQGEVVGKAGQSILGKDLGLHAHFEIRNDGVAVNPEVSFNKTITTIQDTIQKKESQATDEDSAKDDTKVTNENSTKDDTQKTE